MKLKILIPLLLLLSGTSFAQAKPASEDACAVLPTVLEKTAQIRKLEILKTVPCLTQNKTQVKSFILNQIKTKLRPNQMKHEEVFLKEIGFFPDNLDYEKTLIELYLSQLGGYYDPDKNHFIMASWMPAAMQAIVAVHELVHALQDQHFDLSEIIKPDKHTSDVQLARAALVEGDASAVMLDFSFAETKQKTLAEMDASEVENFSKQMVDSMKEMSAGAHGGLEFILVFPYSEGLKFTHQLLQQGGYSKVNEAFQRLPRSTEEILNFKKYKTETPDFKVFKDKTILKELELKKYTVIYSDTYGEFFIKAWLLALGSQKLQAERAAAGWGGDRMLLAEDDLTKKRKLIWKLAWDTKRDADQFFGVVSPALQAIAESKSGRNLKLQRKDLDIYLISDL